MVNTKDSTFYDSLGASSNAKRKVIKIEFVFLFFMKKNEEKERKKGERVETIKTKKGQLNTPSRKSRLESQ